MINKIKGDWRTRRVWLDDHEITPHKKSENYKS